ncbi:MAG: selenide, water dikinase SelD [Planctomycetota bacterium]
MPDKNMPRLTQGVQCAGCAAKIGPGLLAQVLNELKQSRHPNLLVGFETSDDAGVYKLTDDLAIVQTIDFFPPVVDDPYIFGQIAAANALSDIYAMGAKPLTAMNVIAFPIHDMDIAVLKEIMKGGLQKLDEAGVTLVGGHSIEDKEIKYGLSVTGIIHPEKILTNNGIKVNDNIILTKPLGVGIVNTAVKAGLASSQIIEASQQVMITLNRVAAEVMLEIGVNPAHNLQIGQPKVEVMCGVNACTDVTGFGLLGHLCEMIAPSQSGIIIETSTVPVLDKVEEFAQMGLIPAGTYRNRNFREKMIKKTKEIPEYLMDILFDPQTSGGLLISVSEEKTDELIRRLKSKNVQSACIIGKVVAEPKGMIVLS